MELRTYAILLLTILQTQAAQSRYVLTQVYAGNNFTAGFNFRSAADYDGGDPTGGFVNYLPYRDASSAGLVQVLNGTQVYVGADHTKTLSRSAQGRDSVRLESKQSFDYGLLVADIAHMPGNQCGIWPAFWTFNFDEDPYAEMDIIEGSMHQRDNIVSLHTCGACSFDLSGQPGENPRSNCDLGGSVNGRCRETGNTNYDGCGADPPSRTPSYGDRFNAAGGGVYATLVAEDAVRIWFWPRDEIPADVDAGRPDPSGWADPFVSFETAKSRNNCRIGKFFKKNSIIINIDFCGAEIDQDYWDSDEVCSRQASDCVSFVAKNPGSFKEAYWLFNYIKVYEE